MRTSPVGADHGERRQRLDDGGGARKTHLATCLRLCRRAARQGLLRPTTPHPARGPAQRGRTCPANSPSEGAIQDSPKTLLGDILQGPPPGRAEPHRSARPGQGGERSWRHLRNAALGRSPDVGSRSGDRPINTNPRPPPWGHEPAPPPQRSRLGVGRTSPGLASKLVSAALCMTPPWTEAATPVVGSSHAAPAIPEALPRSAVKAPCRSLPLSLPRITDEVLPTSRRITAQPLAWFRKTLDKVEMPSRHKARTCAARGCTVGVALN